MTVKAPSPEVYIFYTGCKQARNQAVRNDLVSSRRKAQLNHEIQTREQSAPEMVLETMAEYHELHEWAVSTKFSA